jgi:hypothetical protein
LLLFCGGLVSQKPFEVSGVVVARLNSMTLQGAKRNNQSAEVETGGETFVVQRVYKARVMRARAPGQTNRSSDDLFELSRKVCGPHKGLGSSSENTLFLVFFWQTVALQGGFDPSLTTVQGGLVPSKSSFN